MIKNFTIVMFAILAMFTADVVFAQGPPPPPPEVTEVTGFTAYGELPEPTYSAPVIAEAEADMLQQYQNYVPPVGYKKVGGNGNRTSDYELVTIWESGVAVAYSCTFEFSISIIPLL